MKKLLGFSLMLFLAIQGFAQNEEVFKEKWEEADGYYVDGNFDAAAKVYKELLGMEPENANILFRLGHSVLNSSGDQSKAIHYLEKASENTTKKWDPYSGKEKQSPITVHFYLGQAYHINYEFDKAITTFEDYRVLVGKDKDENEAIDRQIEICNTAKLLVSDPRNINVTNLGSSVNSKYPEYAPILSADEQTLMFTSKRAGSTGGEILEDGAYYEDIYICNKLDNGQWSDPKPISTNINTNDHEATIGLSVDGSQLLIYRSDNNGRDGNIYYSQLQGDVWTVPVKMGTSINSKYQETHAVFSADGNTIYFTSDRPTGFGGLDIYKVSKLPNGDWGKAQNLGPQINTKYNDRSPFMHPDGVSLFFASEGHSTMGGFDVFVATFDEEDMMWSTPENIGYPINTTGNDVFYVTSTDGQRAYYSSRAGDGAQGMTDLYMITMPQKPAAALTLIQGEFTLGDAMKSVPEDAIITVTDNETGDIVGVYKPNSKTGKYLFILPPGKNYNVTYEADGYLFQSDNLIIPKNSVFAQVEKPVELAPITSGQSIVLNNIFFEFDKAVITDESKIELEKLYRLMVNNASIKIEISGHTDSKGSDSYNKRLSQERAQAVVDYLISKGINPERMTAVGYGEEKPIAKNENEDGSDNEEGRAMNRRIELQILQSDGNTDIVNEIVVPDYLKKKKQ